MHGLNGGHVLQLVRGSNGMNTTTHHCQVFWIWCHLYLLFNGMSSHGCCSPGDRFDIKTIFPSIGISIMQIRQLWDHLFFIMGIPIPVRQCLYTGTVPWLLASPRHQQTWYMNWLQKENSSLSFTRKDFDYLCQISAEKCQKIQIYIHVCSPK